MLLGRNSETAQLRQLIQRVRAGHGGALALEGEPGAGKTALLGDAVAQARDMVVLSARGVPTETQISFSGLWELLRPVLGHLDELPLPQAAALAGALTLGPPVGSDRFAVYAATLGLLARAAQDQAILVAVDDVHWLDPASAEAIRFAARRLGNERVGVLLTLRTGEFDTSGIPPLAVGGLDRDAALALLPAGIAAGVADELLRATAGNALALVELPSMLTTGQLAGREPLDDPVRVGARAERAFQSRVAGLARPARTALLVAAASGSPAMDGILEALTALGVQASALEIAESAGLVTIDAHGLEFRHPLVRSIVYHAASAAERRAAHRALASALGSATDVHGAVRRAWHLAGAALGPDERVAAELDHAAQGARARSGYAEAAIAFERAAELTPAGDERARRSLRAAEAWQLAGRPARAIELLDAFLPAITQPVLRASAHRLRGRIDVWRGPATAAKDRLVAEASRVEAMDGELAVHMLADAVTGCIVTGAFGEAVELGRRAQDAASRIGGTTELLAALQLGKALVLHGDDEGDALILRCDELMLGDDALVHALELAQCLPILMTIEDYDAARAVLHRLVGPVRASGAFGLLAYCLGAQSELDARTGHWTSAYADGYEAVDLARAAGQEGQLSYNLARLALLEAAQGRDEDCRAHAAEALELAAPFGFGSSTSCAECALALVEFGAGEFEAAADRLGRIDTFEHMEPNRMLWRPDEIEALARTGRTDAAEQALAAFERDVVRTRRPMSMGALYRCRGLLAGDDSFVAEFETALRWHDASSAPYERARTQLCFGERLRRARRRAEARSQLRAAVATFDGLGARPWSDRARAELRASGGTARKRGETTVEQLTAQELQVARIVAEGATNREAAAALFVSPKTIESHLASAYRKLGIRSRTELARYMLVGEPSPA